MNCMLTAVGFLMLLIIVVLLLTGKVSLPPIFVVVPVVACLICGFGLAQINDFIGTGLKSVLNTVALFTFAVLYFSILNDVGMFDVIVSKLMRYLGNKVEVVMWITCLVATISHLDGSGATTNHSDDASDLQENENPPAGTAFISSYLFRFHEHDSVVFFRIASYFRNWRRCNGIMALCPAVTGYLPHLKLPDRNPVSKNGA